MMAGKKSSWLECWNDAAFIVGFICNSVLFGSIGGLLTILAFQGLKHFD